MIIRRIVIKNFRAIEELDWLIPAGKKLICIVGKGDSGKSTILEAIDWLLGDRWNLPVDIFDFRDNEKPIEIEAAIGEIPQSLASLDAFGLCMSGIKSDGNITTTPGDDCEPCVILKLTISNELDPSWTIEKGDFDEARPCPAALRRKLGLGRLGEKIDTHLKWSRSSALGRISKDTDGSHAALLEATLAARDAVDAMKLTQEFESILSKILAAAQGYGASEFKRLKPGIDLSNSASYGGVALCSDQAPLYKYGLGTRRLTSLAIQRASAHEKATLLIDEIESGLEPHRAVGLIDALRSDDMIKQAFVTTHSNAIVEYCDADCIAVLINNGGKATVQFLPPDLESLHRSSPSSFLARRVVVVEGKTEVGVLMAFFEYKDEEARSNGKPTTKARGFVICDSSSGKTGGGAQACKNAQRFSSLGYETVLLLDSDDNTIENHVDGAQESSVKVIRWKSGQSVENAIFEPLDHKEMQLLLERISEEDFLGSSRVESDLKMMGFDDTLHQLVSEQYDALDLDVLRNTLASVARTKGWFKSVPKGRKLGDWIFQQKCADEAFMQSVFIKRLESVLSEDAADGDGQ